MPPDLAAWAHTLAGDDRSDGAGGTEGAGGAQGAGGELLGTGLHAGTYAALLWNGARLHRAVSASAAGGPTLSEALALLALTCGETPGSARFAAAVRAGETEGERTTLAVRVATSAVPQPPAGLTTTVVPAAACAWMCVSPEETDPGQAMDAGLRDLAAALLVVHAPGGETSRDPREDEAPGCGLLLGHALAAGWLATQLQQAGVVGAPGSLELTLTAVLGAP